MTKPTQPEPLTANDIQIIQRDFEVFQVCSSTMQRKMFAELMHLRSSIARMQPVMRVVDRMDKEFPKRKRREPGNGKEVDRATTEEIFITNAQIDVVNILRQAKAEGEKNAS